MKTFRGVLIKCLPIFLILVLIIFVSQLFFQSLIQTVSDSAWDELSMTHAESAEDINTRLDINRRLLNLTAEAIADNADFSNADAVSSYLKNVQSSTIFDRIDLVYPNGTILVTSSGDLITDTGRKTFDELVNIGPHISARETDFLDERRELIYMFAPVYDSDGAPIAIIAASIYSSTLSAIFASDHYEESSRLFLTDMRDGNTVFDTSGAPLGNIDDFSSLKVTEEFKGTDFAKDVKNRKSGKTAFTADNGDVSYVIYAPLSELNFSLSLAVNEDAIFSTVNRLKETVMWVGIIEALLCIIFSAWSYLVLRSSILNKKSAQEAELELLHRKEEELKSQYQNAASRQSFLESMAKNMPGGYHRCTSDHSFSLTFVSDSFTKVTGYTAEQLKSELNNSYMGIVAPEDREYFMSLAPMLERDGFIECAYRIRRRDGSIRWVQDSTQHIERDGESYYQCSLADIDDVITEQEKLARQANMLDILEENMPGGYHRCQDAEGLPFLYISSSFEEVTGWSREEIESEFDNKFINLVLPEDVAVCLGFIEDVVKYGYSNSTYRIKKKNGGYIWVSDSTVRVMSEGEFFFHGVLADISEQIEELERAKETAEANSRAKSTFLFNISHDIRTPINAIKGFSGIIADNTENAELVRSTIKKIQHSSNALMTLINDVLDLARIERGKEEVNLEEMEIMGAAHTLIEMFKSEMESAGIKFIINSDITHRYVLCDTLKITRVAMNMLSNAKKFTPRGGTVTFGVKELESNGETAVYRMFVRDTGVGMSPEFLSKAFEPFERERTSTESKISGSGLGLSIIKNFVELMGGKLSIESELGKGTEIAATLELRLVSKDERESESRSQADKSIGGKRVLVVEDNAFNREIARYILESLGLSVEEAENGIDCLEKLKAVGGGYYDLILMDIQMPMMDGYTATENIRALSDKNLAGIPVIAMTANAFDEDKEKCILAGMNGHIGKPIDIPILRRVLENFLS